MRTETSTAAAFVTRLLRAAGGIGEEQLRCFREYLQEALRGERRPGPLRVGGANAANAANAALCSLPQSTTNTTGSPRRRPRAPGTGALGSTIRWTR